MRAIDLSRAFEDRRRDEGAERQKEDCRNRDEQPSAARAWRCVDLGATRQRVYPLRRRDREIVCDARYEITDIPFEAVPRIDATRLPVEKRAQRWGELLGVR